MSFEREKRFHEYPPVGDDVYGLIFLPYSDLRYGIPEGGIHEEFSQASDLWRLSRIKQLSNLAYIGPDPETQYFNPTDHTRLYHSEVVSAVTEYILLNNGFINEEVELGIVASLLHDVATPARGDPTMNVDPENLDEENNFAKALFLDTHIALFKHGMNYEEIEQIVNNVGVLGDILDIADRITYVMHDIYFSGLRRDSGERDEYNQEISEIFDRFPEIGNIYKDVRYNKENNDVYFSDPEKLGAFLKLRALISSKMYSHPFSQGRDLMFELMIKPLYSSVPGERPLDPINLRQMSDHNLDELLFGNYGDVLRLDPRSQGNKHTFQQAVINFCPDYLKVQNDKEAEDLKKHLAEKGAVVLGIKRNHGFNPATKYLTQTPEDKIMSFKEYDPKTAGEIEEMSEELKGYYVYYVDPAARPYDAEAIQAVRSKQ